MEDSHQMSEEATEIHHKVAETIREHTPFFHATGSECSCEWVSSSGKGPTRWADHLSEVVLVRIREIADEIRERKDREFGVALGQVLTRLGGTCPTECDPDCGALCHEGHQVLAKREHDVAECEARQR